MLNPDDLVVDSFDTEDPFTSSIEVNNCTGCVSGCGIISP